MSSSARLRATVVLALSLLAVPAAGALAQEPAADQATVEPAATAEATPAEAGSKADPGDQPTATAIRLQGLRGGKVTAGKRIKVAGTVRPFQAGQKITIVLNRGKKTVKRQKVRVTAKGKGSSLGQFHFSRKMVGPGMYRIQALLKSGPGYGGSKAASRPFRIRYPSLKEGNSGPAVKTLNQLLDDLGFVTSNGSSYSSATGRAVLAYRKVNNMARKEKATGSIFKKLAKGKGGFKLKYPGAGKHVEADLSRQVMVLAKNGEVDEIYTISSGAPATPTITGSFRFYRKDAGYNSLGMYFSAYFIRGYATHGYHDVPTYPASHGCLRNPIPDSVHIYNWIDIGDPIFVYN